MTSLLDMGADVFSKTNMRPLEMLFVMMMTNVKVSQCGRRDIREEGT